MRKIKTAFDILIILLLIGLCISNQDRILLGMWPFDTRIEVVAGFAFILIFILSFMAGGIFVWLGAGSELRKKLKNAKAQIKELEKQLKIPDN